MKVLHCLPSEQKAWAERFIRGAKAGGKVHHPNLLKVVGAGKFKENYFVLSEFVEGMSVRQYMDDYGILGALEAYKAVDIAIQIAEALVAARKAGIVHRNIKPENVLIGDDGVAKLADLEIAKEIATGLTRQLTRQGELLGDLRYSAPEQIMDASTVDHRADIYSFGATLYSLVTGHRPFDDVRDVDLLDAEHRPPPESPEKFNISVPDNLCDIIRRAMHPDVRRRYQEPQGLLDDLKHLRSVMRD